MRLVRWTDEQGYQRQVFANNDDTDVEAQVFGVPHESPIRVGLEGIPETIKVNLHNELMRHGLFSYADVLLQQNGITSIIGKLATEHQLTRRETREIKLATISLYRRTP